MNKKTKNYIVKVAKKVGYPSDIIQQIKNIDTLDELERIFDKMNCKKEGEENE